MDKLIHKYLQDYQADKKRVQDECLDDICQALVKLEHGIAEYIAYCSIAGIDYTTDIDYIKKRLRELWAN